MRDRSYTTILRHFKFLICIRASREAGEHSSKELAVLFLSQIPVVEQAIETAALMLGKDKSRGYCLEMICADFLAGATLDGANPDLVLQSQLRFFKFLNPEQRGRFVAEVTRQS